MGRYFANAARDRPRVGPGDLPGAIGILADADKPGEIVGIAFGAGHVGGWRWDWGRPGSEPEDHGPREATWGRPNSRVTSRHLEENSLNSSEFD
jgi:hypothetical protein